MDEITAQNGNFAELKKDPLFLSSIINKSVKVEILKDVYYSGYLESIDPLQYCTILNMSHGEEYKKVLIPGETISNITVLEDSQDLKKNYNETLLNSEEILERKHKLLLWLEKNLLPVKESGENIVVGNVSILPPYSESDICTLNSTVATQVKKIISNMP